VLYLLAYSSRHTYIIIKYLYCLPDHILVHRLHLNCMDILIILKYCTMKHLAELLLIIYVKHIFLFFFLQIFI